MPKTAQQLADELTPQARETLLRYHDTFVRNAGHLLRREAATILWPSLVAEVNTGLVCTLDLVLTRFGQMTVNDMIAYVVDHTKSKGLQPHPSYLESIMHTDQIKAQATARAQEYLETSDELEAGTFGAGPPVVALAGTVGPIVAVFVDFVEGQFGSILANNEQAIVDFAAKHAADFVKAALAQMKKFHTGK